MAWKNVHVPHIEGILLKEIDSDVGLVFGNNVADVYKPLELKVSPQGSTRGIRSLFGWILCNILRQASNDDFEVISLDLMPIQKTESLKRLAELYQQSDSVAVRQLIVDYGLEPSQDDKLFIEKGQAPKKEKQITLKLVCLSVIMW